MIGVTSYGPAWAPILFAVWTVGTSAGMVRITRRWSRERAQAREEHGA